MSQPLEIVPTDRQVICQQLLAALDDTSKVAILATKEDLDILIQATKNGGLPGTMKMFNDLWELRRAAFGS